MQKQNDYSAKMNSKSEAELLEYTNNLERYQEAAILAAIWELESRGVSNESLGQTEEVLQNILDAKLSPLDIELTEATALQLEAPELYTPLFVKIFGLFFSVFGGSILMAINFYRLGKKNVARQVLIVGFAYSLLQGILLNLLGPQANLLSVPLSFVGVILLENMFWKKYVEPGQTFTKRNFLPPLTIGIGIAVLLLYVMMQSGLLVQ